MHTARFRSAAALLLLGAALAGRGAAQDAPRGEVRGVVRAAHDSLVSPLPHAMVELIDAGRRRVVLADGLGRYHLRGVAPGLVRIRALHAGHKVGQVEVLVPSGSSVAVDLELIRKPIEMPEFTVLAAGVTVPEVSPRDLRVAAPAWAASEVALRTLAEGTGMAEAGVLRARGGAGGGGDPSDPRDVLLMRGSTTDLKLVLLDGAPVYTPFHLGGLLPSFDATTMGGAVLHVGGAPARYDGGLSYILDLRTRRPRRDRLHGGGALDLMSGQASIEGPLGERAGLLLAGRALHDAAALVWGGAGSPYGYADALLRFDAEPAAGHRLGVTAFANHESVFLDLASTLGLPGPDAARWGNEVASAVYQGVAGATELDVTVAGSRYRAELPIHPTPDAVAAGSADPIVARGETERLRVAVDATHPLSGGALRVGGTVDRLGVSYGARRLVGSVSSATDAGTAGVVAGAYVDWTARASGSLAVRTGLRADHFSADGRLRWAPRVSLHWSLSETALLTLAAGRYHQYTRASDDRVEVAVAGVADGLDWSSASSARLLPVATADHLVLALDQQLSPAVRLGIQGFLKGFANVDGAGGPLASSGLDLRVLREGEEVTGWLGYSLAWFWSSDGRAGSSTNDFTGRHLLSAGLVGRLAGRLGMELRVAFSDGLPYTSIPLATKTAAPLRDFAVPTGEVTNETPALAGGPADGFLRIDAELHVDLLPVWGGRPFALRPYVKVLNALDRRDALFWYFAPWRDPEVKPLAELSLLPVIGLEWRF